MIIPKNIKGQVFGILGLGRTGLATAQALVQGGAKVYVHDDDTVSPDNITEIAYEACPPEKCPPEKWPPEKWPWKTLAAMVISPGIPHLYPEPHPAAALARENGTDIISDIDLLCRAKPQAKIIAITGTNGKSTVVSLIDHILKNAGVKTALGGNIGRPALSLTDPGPQGVIILELSSYQLETTPALSLDAGAVVNITPDHLERHGGWHGYVDAKANLVKAIKPQGVAVFGTHHAHELYAKHSAAPTKRVNAENNHSMNNPGLNNPSLQGPHNAINIAIAIEICRALGLEDAGLAQSLASFKGLPHRLETVGVINDIRFVNDSKATNGDATAEALKSYNDIYWIAGGLAKDNSISDKGQGVTGLDTTGLNTTGLGVAAKQLQNVRRAYMIGTAAKQFAAEIKTHSPPLHKFVTLSGTLASATKAAFIDALGDALGDAQKDSLGDAQKDSTTKPTILLSPAAASFDQFKNFEARGDAFRQIVKDLIAESQTGETP